VNGNAADASHRVDLRIVGVAAGADYRLSPTTVVGTAVAGTSANYGLSQGLGNGQDIAFQSGVYGVTWLNDLYLAAAAAVAAYDVSTSRRVAATGSTLKADQWRSGVGSRIEAGQKFTWSDMTVTPFGALLGQSIFAPAHRERSTSGPGAVALKYRSDHATRVRSELGIGVERMIETGSNPVLLFARTAWAHEFSRRRATTANFVGFPNAPFTTRGAELSDAALVTAGAAVGLGGGLVLRAKLDGEFGATLRTYAANLSLRATW
jgi:uncharacterized protein with beta-barrel porin domain